MIYLVWLRRRFERIVLRLIEQAREAGSGKIGLQEFLRRTGVAEHGFGGEIAAADGTFHRGGPTGRGPIPGEIEAGSLCLLGRAPMSTPGAGEKVAAASLMTVALTSCASRAAGSAWRISLRHRSMISWRGFWSRS